MARKLLALVLLLFATPALATSYVGTVNGPGQFYLPVPSGPGKYQMDVAFSEPLMFDITMYIKDTFEYHDPDTGEYLWGDDAVFENIYEFYTPTPSGIVQWANLPPYSYVSNGYLVTGHYEQFGATLSILNGFDAPVSYTISITPAAPDASAVPEPAQWLLLIGGFGLAGAALRRRTRAEPSLAPSA